MILYNITYNIDKGIDEEWLEWLKEYYLPEIMISGYFVSYKVYRLLKSEDDGSINYAVQLLAESIDRLNEFLITRAPVLSKQLQDKFRHRHAAFMTVLQDTGL
jgi:hypothetical protein